MGAIGWLWLDATFGEDPPLRVRSGPADFAPWPSELEVIDARTVMGGPSVSIQTAPDVERFYVLVAPTDQAGREAVAAVAEHLRTQGWAMEPEEEGRPPAIWFEFSGPGPRGERAYVGSLSAYLDSGGWVAEDGDAGPLLRTAAGERLDSAVVVQVFASG